MSNEHKLRDSDGHDDEELDRDAIIKRRQRFVKASLGVLALSALGAAAEACACLSQVAPDTGVTDAAQDAQGDVSGPQVCLSARPPDAESDAESDASASSDGEATG